MSSARRAGDFLGSYRPGTSPAHRMSVGWKYLVVALVGVSPFLVRRWWYALVCLGLAVLVCLVLARLPARTALRLGPALWTVNLAILGYHWITGDWQRGVVYIASVTACVYVARMLTCTTDPGTIMDAVAACARPFRPLGARPEKFALTVALMWTTIPYLMSSVAGVRDAARARGMGRSAWRFVLPVVVGAVGHALELGDALRARGLGEEPDEEDEGRRRGPVTAGEATR